LAHSSSSVMPCSTNAIQFLFSLTPLPGSRIIRNLIIHHRHKEAHLYCLGCGMECPPQSNYCLGAAFSSFRSPERLTPLFLHGRRFSRRSGDRCVRRRLAVFRQYRNKIRIGSAEFSQTADKFLHLWKFGVVSPDNLICVRAYQIKVLLHISYLAQ